jgi:hypothetical protein
MKLTFKKAFGFDFVSTDHMMWLMEIGQAQFRFTAHKKWVTISVGEFGAKPREASAVNGYLTSGRRPFVGTLLTLDVGFDVEDDIAESMRSKVNEIGAADEVVLPHVETAWGAAQRFVEEYRHIKYMSYRRTDRWRTQQVFLPKLSDDEFRTYLFYVLECAGTGDFIGSFSRGKSTFISTADTNLAVDLQAALVRSSLDTPEKFVDLAWERYFDTAFVEAAIYAAIAVEVALVKRVRFELENRSAGTLSQIGKAVDDTSNRLLCTVLLGLFGIGNQQLRDRIVALFEMRNAIAHGNKKRVSQDEASDVLQATELFFDALRNTVRPTMGTLP